MAVADGVLVDVSVAVPVAVEVAVCVGVPIGVSVGVVAGGGAHPPMPLGKQQVPPMHSSSGDPQQSSDDKQPVASVGMQHLLPAHSAFGAQQSLASVHERQAPAVTRAARTNLFAGVTKHSNLACSPGRLSGCNTCCRSTPPGAQQSPVSVQAGGPPPPEQLGLRQHSHLPGLTAFERRGRSPVGMQHCRGALRVRRAAVAGIGTSGGARRYRAPCRHTLTCRG